MTTHHHFLAAILCDLGNTTPVLLLADWLEEEGESGAQWWRELAAGMAAALLEYAISRDAVEIFRWQSHHVPALSSPESELNEVVRDFIAGSRIVYVECDRGNGENLEVGTVRWLWRDGQRILAEIDWSPYWRCNQPTIILYYSAELQFCIAPDEMCRTGLSLRRVAVILPPMPYSQNIEYSGLPRPASATLPLSRLAAGVRQRLESHPDT